MKKCIRICSLVILVMFVALSINPTDSFARRHHKYQQELTDNPKLDEANKLYKKAVHSIEYGDGVHEPKRAAQHYADAESYLRRTIFALKELGNKYDIDVTKEVAFCENLERETHSKQGMAKKAAAR